MVSIGQAKTILLSGNHPKKRPPKSSKCLARLSKVWAPGLTLRCSSEKTQMSQMSRFHPVLLRLSQSSRMKKTMTMDKGHLKAKTPQIKYPSNKAHLLDSSAAL